MVYAEAKPAKAAETMVATEKRMLDYVIMYEGTEGVELCMKVLMLSIAAGLRVEEDIENVG